MTRPCNRGARSDRLPVNSNGTAATIDATLRPIRAGRQGAPPGAGGAGRGVRCRLGAAADTRPPPTRAFACSYHAPSFRPLKLLRHAEVIAAARPKLRGEHADTGSASDLIDRIEQIDDVEAHGDRLAVRHGKFVRYAGIDLTRRALRSKCWRRPSADRIAAVVLGGKLDTWVMPLA